MERKTDSVLPEKKRIRRQTTNKPKKTVFCFGFFYFYDWLIPPCTIKKQGLLKWRKLEAEPDAASDARQADGLGLCGISRRCLNIKAEAGNELGLYDG